MFLMWVGEQVTERGIGNGVSMIIFAGIVAGLPGAALGTWSRRVRRHDPLAVITILAMVLVFTYFVVFMERGPAPHHRELRAPPGRARART